MEKVANFFKPHEDKTIIVTDEMPGGIVPVDSLKDTVILLPCPFQFRLTKTCICMTCNFVAVCPMEQMCRNAGCENAYIRGCTNYKNEEEMYTEEKRIVFKNGSSFDNSIFRFSGKESKL